VTLLLENTAASENLAGMAEAELNSTVLHSPEDLAEWIADCRHRPAVGNLTQAALAARLEIGVATVQSWEKEYGPRMPTLAQIERIAELCGVTPPLLCFDQPIKRQPGVQDLYAPRVSTLTEEILWVGRVLSSRGFRFETQDRNARIFHARFGGLGERTNTLRAIGTQFGVLGERVRRIVEQQLIYLNSTSIRRDCFDALYEACTDVRELSPKEMTTRLRPLLGEKLSLANAMKYGDLVLKKRLPIKLR
jgi:transcriptional regulator with XRE-family HTH domain